MKYRNLILTTALAFAGAACDKKAEGTAPAAAAAPAVPAVDPKMVFGKALDAFTDEVNGIEKEKSANPMELMKKLPALLAKLEKIPTTGLPEDVVTAFGKLAKVNAAMGALIAKIPADLPSDPAAIPAYMQAHPEVMKTMMEMQTSMAPLKAESDAAQKEFESAATKNGMDVSKFLKAGEALGAQ